MQNTSKIESAGEDCCASVYYTTEHHHHHYHFGNTSSCTEKLNNSEAAPIAVVFCFGIIALSVIAITLGIRHAILNRRRKQRASVLQP